MAYTGTGSGGQTNANTLQDCEAACSANIMCKGATFIAGKCNLRTGDSPIIPSSNDSYAIIPKSKQLLMNMEDLNTQLLMLNKEIINKINNTQPVYDNLIVENNEKSKELLQNYKELEIERENIDKLLEQYESLDITEKNNQIYVNKNYYSYILLFVLAIAIIVVLFKISTHANLSNGSSFQYGGELNQNAYNIVFTIILLVIAINLSVKYFSL